MAQRRSALDPAAEHGQGEAEMFGKLPVGSGCRLVLVVAAAGSERAEWLRRWAAGRGFLAAKEKGHCIG